MQTHVQLQDVVFIQYFRFEHKIRHRRCLCIPAHVISFYLMLREIRLIVEMLLVGNCEPLKTDVYRGVSVFVTLF